MNTVVVVVVVVVAVVGVGWTNLTRALLRQPPHTPVSPCEPPLLGGVTPAFDPRAACTGGGRLVCMMHA